MLIFMELAARQLHEFGRSAPELINIFKPLAGRQEFESDAVDGTGFVVFGAQHNQYARRVIGPTGGRSGKLV
jgi:hypothetical protein